MASHRSHRLNRKERPPAGNGNGALFNVSIKVKGWGHGIGASARTSRAPAPALRNGPVRWRSVVPCHCASGVDMGPNGGPYVHPREFMQKH